MTVARGHAAQRTLSVAVAFWGLCLVLVVLEASIGENVVSSGLFLLSVPALVVALTWVNRTTLRARERVSALLVLGISVLVYASIILFVGLLAASALKQLLI